VLAPGSGRRLLHLVCIAVVALAAFVGYYWYDAALPTNPELGVSFSCRQVRYLGGDCAAAYTALLDDLGVKHVRLSLYWSDVETVPGTYDFSEADALIQCASVRGADVLLTIGIKAQRFPEVYLPGWLLERDRPAEGTVLDSLPGVHDATLRYIEAAVEHFRGEPAVVAWQVENEPFIKNFDKIGGWTVSPAMTAAEVAVVRRSDSANRPVVVTHSSWTIYDQAWKQALRLGDVVGQNVFTKKAWIRDWWYFFPYRMGPFVPDLPAQARAAGRSHKQLWITELQAEPEERRSLPAVQPSETGSFSARRLQENVLLARRSRAERVYLWGAEWWYATRDAPGFSAMWAAAKQLFAQNQRSQRLP